MNHVTHYTIRRGGRHGGAALAGGAAALCALLVSMPYWAEASTLRLLVEFSCYLVLAQMWNLLAGYGGLISIGQQGFVGLGGYGLFLAANHFGINPFVAVPLGGLVAAALALPAARIAFRLRGGYFAIGTWVMAEVFRLGMSNVTLLGGGSGQSLTALAGMARGTREAATFWTAGALALAAVGGVYLLLRSRFGLALTAIRDSEAAAESQGVDVRRVKLQVYLLSAFGSGLAGALYYLNVLRIAPNSAFDLGWAVSAVFIVVVGGIGTIEGPIVGALLFFLLRETLSDYGSWYLMIMGAVAIVVMVRWPKGIWGTFQQRYDVRLFPLQRRVERRQA